MKGFLFCYLTSIAYCWWEVGHMMTAQIARIIQRIIDQMFQLWQIPYYKTLTPLQMADLTHLLKQLFGQMTLRKQELGFQMIGIIQTNQSIQMDY